MVSLPEQSVHMVSVWKKLSWKVPTPQSVHSRPFMYFPAPHPEVTSVRYKNE